jgi:Lrp/AsnC family transcriptional regulator for asnA, asnC and gidA
MANTAENTLQLDGIDKIILRALMQNARQSVNLLASQVGISGTAIHQRLKKLEREGVIKGSQVVLNEKVLGYKTLAFVGIFLDKAMRNPEAVKLLKNIPEVIECHYTTGNWSVFIKILCRDNAHLMELLNKEIQTIDGISRTETFISLDQQINRQIGL